MTFAWHVARFRRHWRELGWWQYWLGFEGMVTTPSGRLVQVWILLLTWRLFAYRKPDMIAVAIGPLQVRVYARDEGSR